MQEENQTKEVAAHEEAQQHDQEQPVELLYEEEPIAPSEADQPLEQQELPAETPHEVTEPEIPATDDTIQPETEATGTPEEEPTQPDTEAVQEEVQTPAEEKPKHITDYTDKTAGGKEKPFDYSAGEAVEPPKPKKAVNAKTGLTLAGVFMAGFMVATIYSGNWGKPNVEFPGIPDSEELTQKKRAFEEAIDNFNKQIKTTNQNPAAISDPYALELLDADTAVVIDKLGCNKEKEAEKAAEAVTKPSPEVQEVPAQKAAPPVETVAPKKKRVVTPAPKPVPKPTMKPVQKAPVTQQQIKPRDVKAPTPAQTGLAGKGQDGQNLDSNNVLKMIEDALDNN
ncbi:MAG: hypothetical protein RBQ99_01770 [Trichlorobacter sp.]|nr:hypothetical protein [Trichlorobacter sp.]